MEPKHAAVDGTGVITSVIVCSPEIAQDWRKRGWVELFFPGCQLVDITGVTPEPGIGWTRSGKAWTAPTPPPPDPVPEPTPSTPGEGDTAMATVTDDDPLTIDVAGVSYPARRLQAYTPLLGDDVKATWLDGGWVVEDAIEPTTGTT